MTIRIYDESKLSSYKEKSKYSIELLRPRDGQNVDLNTEVTEANKSQYDVIKRIEVFPNIYWNVLWVYLGIHGGILGALYITGYLTVDAIMSWFSITGLVIGLQLLHFALSLKTIAPNEIGGLLFFGKPTERAQPGLVVVPWGLIQLIKLPRNPNQVQFPGNPEEIYRDGDKEYFKLSPEERGRLVLPIRALTKGPDSEAAGGEASILDTQMTIEPTFVVRWTIDETFWIFLIRIGDLDEANRQLRDSGEKVVIQEIAKRTLRELAGEIGEVSDALRKTLDEATEDWGVTIDEASMLSPDIGKDVNKSLQRIAIAKADATATVVTAEATRERLTREGAGAANAKLAELEALAKGRKDLGVTGHDLLDLEKARALAQGKTTIFVDGGQGANLLGIGARIAAGADAAKASTETN